MKKKILGFALVATMVGSIAAGCGSGKEAGTSDSTTVDSGSTTTPPASTDTTTKKDTTAKPPQ